MHISKSVFLCTVSSKSISAFYRIPPCSADKVGEVGVS